MYILTKKIIGHTGVMQTLFIWKCVTNSTVVGKEMLMFVYFLHTKD